MKISKVGGLLAVIWLALAVSARAQFGDVDLVVKSMELLPNQPEPGDTVKIIAVIANQGRSDTPDGFEVQVRVDDWLRGSGES